MSWCLRGGGWHGDRDGRGRRLGDHDDLLAALHEWIITQSRGGAAILRRDDFAYALFWFLTAARVADALLASGRDDDAPDDTLPRRCGRGRHAAHDTPRSATRPWFDLVALG